MSRPNSRLNRRSYVDQTINSRKILEFIKKKGRNKRVTGTSTRELARSMRVAMKADPASDRKIEEIIISLIDRFLVIFRNRRLKVVPHALRGLVVTSSRKAKLSKGNKPLRQPLVFIVPSIDTDETRTAKPYVPSMWAEFDPNTDPNDPRLLEACGLTGHKLVA